MPTPRLDPAALAELPHTLPGWRHAAAPEGGGLLHREFVFRDFRQAFGFMAQVALAAEKLDHHPDWSNSYRTVSISLTTHDAGGLTAKDVALARLIDHAFATR
jgi:4a-hydroxytetrahydrobiopterin dehydratase